MSLERMHRVRLAAGAALIVLGMTLPLGAADFIRGDANGDRSVTISDPHFLLSYLFRGLAPPECLDAGDANDTGQVDLSDAVFMLTHLVLGGPPFPAPFPGAGPDPTPDDIHCRSYGGRAALVDAAAALEILDAVGFGTRDQPPGQRGLVKITVAVSSSRPLGGYSGAILLPPGVVAGVDHDPIDLSGTLDRGFAGASLDDDLFRFGYVASLTEMASIPPGQGVPALELQACLLEGVPAGEYPLALVTGELADFESGSAIQPQLASVPLTVLSDFTGQVRCANDPEEPRIPLNAVYRLDDVVAPPGGTAVVPFSIRADAGVQGYAFSVDFDEELLEGIRVEQVWQKPEGSNPRYGFSIYEVNNHNQNPGSAGVDEGFIVGAAVFDLVEPVAMPADADNLALRFHMAVKEGAPDGPTTMGFLDGGRGTGQPVRNSLTALGETVVPATAESFLLIDCLFHVLPDGAVFIRGDANGDGKLDISDPVKTLRHLFLEDGPLLCPDAADANDDGKLDMSDAVATLDFLFRGKSALPPPGGAKGDDPTPDELGCFSPL